MSRKRSRRKPAYKNYKVFLSEAVNVLLENLNKRTMHTDSP